MPHNVWPKPFRNFSDVRVFLITLTVILALVDILVACFLCDRADKLLLLQAREQAMAYADLLKNARTWNADYDGVYVEKKKGVESSRYLQKLGIDPDIMTADGRAFTLRNHAVMTKEISVLSEECGGAVFRIVSDHPINPENTPDPLEKDALRQFRQGKKELSQLVKTSDRGAQFLFVRPFYAEKSCQNCHAAPIGSVLGVVSIATPVSGIVQQTRTTKSLIWLTAMVILGLMCGIMYLLTWRLVVRLDVAKLRLDWLASTDELTGLGNLRSMRKRLEGEYERSNRLGEPLCIIMIDIDHFKRINDTWGHPFGDYVLKWVASRMNDVVRGYDIVSRIGGEEFLVIAPGTTLEEAVILAERLRTTIGTETIHHGETEISVTLSAGVALMSKEDSNVEDIIKRADDALYQAKEAGRNRVMVQ